MCCLLPRVQMGHDAASSPAMGPASSQPSTPVYDLDLDLMHNLMLYPFDEHPVRSAPGGVRAAHVRRALIALNTLVRAERHVDLPGGRGAALHAVV